MAVPWPTAISCSSSTLTTELSGWPFTLTTDSLTFEKDTKGREIPYLTYVPEKLSHGGSKRVSARTVALPGAETAFNLLLELRKRIPGYGATDRLFILDGHNNVRTGFR